LPHLFLDRGLEQAFLSSVQVDGFVREVATDQLGEERRLDELHPANYTQIAYGLQDQPHETSPEARQGEDLPKAAARFGVQLAGDERAHLGQ
jgi:hypothetical protein